ncbi:MAG: DNA-processing protein DprA [Chlamydiales bacterium]
MPDTETEQLVRLMSFPYIGSVKARMLLQYFGSLSQVFTANPQEFILLPGFGDKIVSAWKDWLGRQDWKNDYKKCLDNGISIIPYTSPHYPEQLKKIPDFPLILYATGSLESLKKPSIAIIGTRNCSQYGRLMAEGLGRKVAESGYSVTSGLARGIDTAAHQGALQTGFTTAVIGSGLGAIYPRENEALAEHIKFRGALISEFPYSTPPDKQNFPQRNRIVSGLSCAVVLVESPVRGGAMITMQLAQAQQKVCCALPGRADMSSFEGNHKLIKEGIAHLIENVNDILTLVDPFSIKTKVSTPSMRTCVPLEDEEVTLLKMLPDYEISIEQIKKISGFTPAKLNVLLMSLMLKRVIKEHPGKFYRKSDYNYG